MRIYKHKINRSLPPLGLRISDAAGSSITFHHTNYINQLYFDETIIENIIGSPLRQTNYHSIVQKLENL